MAEKEHEVELIFPPPQPIAEVISQLKARQEQETGDYEDVTFTGPVFPRVSTSRRGKATPAPGTAPNMTKKQSTPDESPTTPVPQLRDVSKSRKDEEFDRKVARMVESLKRASLEDPSH